MSQCDRVMAVLADGQSHSIREIHERAGTMRLNSRIAELRKRGHVIVCDRGGGDYAYQLISLDAPEQQSTGAGSGSGASSEGGEARACRDLNAGTVTGPSTSHEAPPPLDIGGGSSIGRAPGSFPPGDAGSTPAPRFDEQLVLEGMAA